MRYGTVNRYGKPREDSYVRNVTKYMYKYIVISLLHRGGCSEVYYNIAYHGEPIYHCGDVHSLQISK